MDQEPEITEGEDAESTEGEEPDGLIDQLGIPMSREPTLDDVRSDGEQHRRFAMGCSVAVVLSVAAFFVIRVLLLG